MTLAAISGFPAKLAVVLGLACSGAAAQRPAPTSTSVNHADHHSIEGLYGDAGLIKTSVTHNDDENCLTHEGGTNYSMLRHLRDTDAEVALALFRSTAAALAQNKDSASHTQPFLTHNAQACSQQKLCSCTITPFNADFLCRAQIFLLYAQDHTEPAGHTEPPAGSVSIPE